MLLSGLSVWVRHDARGRPARGKAWHGSPNPFCVRSPNDHQEFQGRSAGVASCSPRGVETSPLHLCHRGCDPTPRLTETVIVGAVNPDHAEGPRYHVLPQGRRRGGGRHRACSRRAAGHGLKVTARQSVSPREPGSRLTKPIAELQRSAQMSPVFQSALQQLARRI